MTAPTPPATSQLPPVYQSRDLFQGGRLVIIVHAGREYRLRTTQAGKLILTA